MRQWSIILFAIVWLGFIGIAKAQTVSTGYNDWTPYAFGTSVASTPTSATPNFANDEFGVRYWYSSSDISYRVGDPQISSLNYKVDNSETGEMFFYLTGTNSTYLFKGVIGAGGEQNGNVDDSDYNTSTAPIGAKGSDTNSVLSNGRLFYGYADLGYKLGFLSTSGATTSLLGGGGYIQDVVTGHGVTCKQTGSGDFAGECNAGDTLAAANVKALQNEAEWTIFRLGLENYWKPNKVFSWHNEVVAVPYADFTNNDSHYLRTDLGDNTPNIVDHGWGYGVQLESTMEIRLLPSWSLNFGGRYWELWSNQTTTKVGNPEISSEKSYGWDYERWGLFAGMGYHF